MIDIHVIKQCVICDKVLSSTCNNNWFITNHYLCSSECSITYSKISFWNKELNHFIPDILKLNFYRLKVQGIKELTEKNLKNRSDKKW